MERTRKDDAMSDKYESEDEFLMVETASLDSGMREEEGNSSSAALPLNEKVATEEIIPPTNENMIERNVDDEILDIESKEVAKSSNEEGIAALEELRIEEDLISKTDVRNEEAIPKTDSLEQDEQEKILDEIAEEIASQAEEKASQTNFNVDESQFERGSLYSTDSRARSRLPGTSAFMSSCAESEAPDESVASDEWDSVSAFGFVGPMFPMLQTVIQSEPGQAVLEELGSETGQAVLKELGRIHKTLEVMQQRDSMNGSFYSESSAQPPKPAPSVSASKNCTEEQNSNEDDSAMNENALLRALQHRHVVEALQHFFGQPFVGDLVADLSRFAVKNGVQLEKLMEQSFKYVGEFLAALAHLLKAAPELLPMIPMCIKFVVAHASANDEKDQNTTTSSTSSQSGSTDVELCEMEPLSPPPTASPATSLYPSLDTPTSELPAAVVVHRHVLCDGCNADGARERKQQSLRDGNTVGEYIAGIRWKSAVIEDFDLCSSCESSGEYEQKYGPFLKISHPKKAPRELLVVLRDDPLPRLSARGPARYPCTRPVAPTCPSAPQPTASANAAAAAAAPAASVEKAGLLCPRGHGLVPFSTCGGFTCDCCSAVAKFGMQWVGCRRCNWDMCDTCAKAQNFEKVKQATSDASKEKGSEGASSAKAAVPQEEARPRARFIADISLSDGTVVSPNSLLKKVWKVENHGEEKWPQGIRLVNTGGEMMSGPAVGVAIPSIAPGSRYDIELDLVAPERPGRYVGYWRLMTGGENPQRFGHRLWVDISVAENETSDFQRWQEELTKLSEMGFNDVEFNVELLEEEQGNMDNVLQRLL